MEQYNPKNPDLFKQEDLPAPLPPELNIVQVNEGTSTLKNGYFQSKNFRHLRAGFRISEDGTIEAINGYFSGTFNLGGTLVTVDNIDDLQPTIDLLDSQGGGVVSLVPDTYTVTQTFTVPSGVTIDGNGSTINFGGGAYQILIQGTNAYSTGTLTATFGSPNIVGVGTTWTAAMVGQSILIGDYWYTISTRTDNTHIALDRNFIGTNLAGDTYVIATTIDSPSLKNITLYNSSTKLLEIRYVNGMTIDSVVCDTGTFGVYVQDSGSVGWLNSTIGNCTSGGFYGNNIPFSNLNVYFVYNIIGTGIDLIRDTNAAFNTGSVQAITGVGVKLTNCVNMDYAVFSVIQCTSHGLELVSGNGGIDVIDGYINTTGGDGIKLTASNVGIQLITTSIYNTTGYGINNAASTNNSITIGINYYSNCTSGNVNDAGTNTSIIGLQGISAYSPSASGTATLNLANSAIHTITMPAGNITIALSNARIGQPFIVNIIQDSVGSRTVTWFTTIKWAGGSAPTLTTTANKIDTFGFIVSSSGNYQGYVVGQNL